MNTTQQVKKTSHHIQKEVNHMKKSSVHRINGPILENIFKKGIDIQIYNEEHLSKLAIVPIETREKNQSSSVVNDLPPTLSRSNKLTTQTSNTNIIISNNSTRSNNVQDIQRNTNQTSYKPPVQRSNTSSNISQNITKRQETVAGLNIEISEPSKPINKNTNLSNRRTLAKNLSFTIERSETNSQEETINIYKELVTLLEKKCSVLEATSLSQDDKMLKIQNIDKELIFKKESLSKPSTLKSSERTENTELYEVRKNASNDKNDESLFDRVYNEVEDSSDDDDLIYDIEKEIQRKEALQAQLKKQSEKITNNNDFDDYMDQEFDDFNNNGKIADAVHSDVSIIADSRDHISLSKLQSNKSDLTDEAEIEDSHYFSSGQEYSRHQSDIDFVAGGDSVNNGGDESYNPGSDSSSEISDILSTQQKLRKNSDDLVILDNPSKINVKDEPLELINFDDSFDNEVENLPHVILSDESEGEVIELSSDYDAERETNAYNENIDSIDQDFEIICSQPSKINNPTKKLALQDKYNFKSEKLTEDEDSDDDDELQALVFNQIDRSKSLTTTQTRTRPAGENRHPWSDELEDKLQSMFKLNSFRSNQLDAINATLKGQDVFVLMPTGGGKSLCYQLPATVKQGRSQTTLVISPLISLMQDQVDHLRALRINAAMISSKDSADSRRESFQMFRDGALDLIYLSPEMINKSAQCRNTIKRLYENDKLARIVIDEAHCVSSWGHDFRPDYKQLNFFKKEYPDIPMMALTATASMKVRTDILNNLGLNNAVLFKQSFNRPNLVYMVRPKNKNSMFEMITEIKNRFFYNTGIVYCNSKKQCEDTSKLLEANGLSCSFYHAGMLNEDRSEVQVKWQSGEIKIVCATVAFGMGIDKPDVRFVYHHTMPRSLEGYYQECGRAGRDGKTAFCAMYYQYADFKSLESQIKKDKSLTNRELKQRHLEKLHEVLNYCSNTIECRRKLVLQYFNENFDVKLCKKTCDNCKASNIVEHKDITEDATYLLNIVEKIGLEDLTSNYIIDVYRGSRQQKIVNNGHALLEEHGKGSKYLKEDVQRMIQLLLDKGYLREKIGTNGFGFTNTYVKFNKKLKSQLTMTFSASKSPSSTPNASRPSSLAPYGGASSRRTGTSMRMINDVLSKNVDINQEGLKEFQQKKKALIKTQQKSYQNGRKRQGNRGYKRSRRRT